MDLERERERERDSLGQHWKMEMKNAKEKKFHCKLVFIFYLLEGYTN